MINKIIINPITTTNCINNTTPNQFQKTKVIQFKKSFVDSPSADLLKAYYLKPQKNIAFRGIPKSLPYRTIREARDALLQWDSLKSAQYLDISSDDIFPALKDIRMRNYSFLDELKSNDDKKIFIDEYRKFTGFPNLEETSNKIIAEFKRAINIATDYVNTNSSESGKVIIAGHDSVCSVGHRKAFPGSDLDKGYVIIEGDHPFWSDERLVDEYKGQLWEHLDQRLLSVNHKDAFPNVFTKKQILTTINKFDSLIKFDEETFKHFMYKRLRETDPVKGAEFNIIIAKNLPETKDKIEAKNFAYLIETVRDGETSIFPKHSVSPSLMEIHRAMQNSQFCWLSNVTQMGAISRNYNDIGELKSKIQSRERLKSDFENWDIDRQYEVVKEVIKGMSGDESDKFYEYFGGGDLRRLTINDILTGKIDYYYDGLTEHFLPRKDGNESK